MAVYFASDMHLRLDCPERSRRLARWIEKRLSSDSVYLVGDVCDFWYAARQRTKGPLVCEGLRGLAEFKKRGGALTILAGNHDHWLAPYYEATLGATVHEGPVEIEAAGLRIHLTHGHKVGGRPAWKGFMESRAFLETFIALPSQMAHLLDNKLNSTNEVKRISDEAALFPYYEVYASKLDAKVDLAVFGHIHTPFQDWQRRPRLVILGSWHDRTSFLKVGDGEPALIIEDDPLPVQNQDSQPSILNA